MKSEAQTSTSLSFEDAYRRLEEIARILEDGTAPLEKAFNLFEEGQHLLEHCHKLLDQAEKRLKIIQIGEKGVEIREEIFEPPSESRTTSV